MYAALPSAVLGLVMGAALTVVETIHDGNAGRVIRVMLYGAGVGIVCGTVGGLICGSVEVITGSSPFLLLPDLRHNTVALIVRTVEWGFLGAAVGLCPGAVLGSWRRVGQGAFGGFWGGSIGGFLCERLRWATDSSELSQAFGLVMVGAFVGALVGLVEEFAKEYWLIELTTGKEGRSFIIDKAKTVLGQDMMADIPLFRDAAVRKVHARIVKTDMIVYIAAAAGAKVMVNNQVETNHTLSDGDIIGIGKHSFCFRSRRSGQMSSSQVQS